MQITYPNPPKSVYVASAGPDRQKIGFSQNAEQRVARLSSAAGQRLKLIGQTQSEHAESVERVAHWLLRDFRTHGEWFAVSVEVATAAVLSAVQMVKGGFHAPGSEPMPSPPLGGRARSGQLGGRQLNRLTVRRVAEESRPGMHADGGGLYLKIDKSGCKRWVFLYFTDGRRREMGLGSVKTVHLYEARESALAARKKVYAGHDPIAERLAA